MKIRWMIFACVILFTSCHNRGVNNSPTIDSSILCDTMIPFNGTWVTEHYVNKLNRTKSPSQSQDSAYFIQIPKSYKDTANTYVYHEGGMQYYVLKNRNGYYMKQVDGAGDSIEINQLDNGNKLKIWNDVFVKTIDSCGVPEELLFKGKYKLNGKVVMFNGNGTINGLDSLRFYSVENDYIGPGMGDIDIVYLGRTEKERLTHSFLLKGDTLFIYNIKCLEMDSTNGDCLDIERGELKYKLIKN